MYQYVHEQLAHQRQQLREPQGVRRRSLQVAMRGRQQEQHRLER